MKAFRIFQSQLSDLDTACKIFASAIAYQKAQDFPHYQTIERELLEQDIVQGTHYKLMLADEVACMFCICFSDPGIWTHRNSDRAIYLHRITVADKFRGQQLFQYIMDWSIDYCRKHKYDFIRLDTWAHNDKLVDYYKRYGFSFLEYYDVPSDPGISLNAQGNKVALLEYRLDS